LGISYGSSGEELLSRQRIWFVVGGAAVGDSYGGSTTQCRGAGYKISQDIRKEKGGGSIQDSGFQDF
jgi:hypothetical protein